MRSKIRSGASGPRQSNGIRSLPRVEYRPNQRRRSDRGCLWYSRADKQNFFVELGRYDSSTQKCRGREGFVHLPNELAEIVTAVLGLDNRRVIERDAIRRHVSPAGAVPTTPTQVAKLYNFPFSNASVKPSQSLSLPVASWSTRIPIDPPTSMNFANELAFPPPWRSYR
jgi:hypothetical protein